MSAKLTDHELDWLRQLDPSPYVHQIAKLAGEEVARLRAPIPMILFCPVCRARHIDEGEFATHEHHTHACQGCGFVWRPAVVNTVGVNFLPGFKNDPDAPKDQ